MTHKLRLAIQKSGRLSDASIQLLEECGIRLQRVKNKLRTEALNFPLEVLYLRDDDIPGYVSDSVADVGIVGENVAVEKDKPVDTIKRLGFSRCRLSIAVPKSSRYERVEDLQGLNLATSYPKILANYLKKKNIQVNIHEISGSVEIAPGIGLADGICDIVSTGSTLMSNGLRELETILHSEAVLIANRNISEEKYEITEKLVFRFKSVLRAKNYKYILLNLPDDKIEKVCNLLPGMKSPTIVPLAMKGWSSLHSVVNENEFWEVIDSLKEEGAEGILVIPIEKMIQ